MPCIKWTEGVRSFLSAQVVLIKKYAQWVTLQWQFSARLDTNHCIGDSLVFCQDHIFSCGDDRKKASKHIVFITDCMALGIYYLFSKWICFICQLAQWMFILNNCFVQTRNAGLSWGYWSPQICTRCFRDKWNTFTDNFLFYWDWHNEMDNNH